MALIPFEPVAYLDPADGGDARLVCRHGSLTAEEMLVPLVAGRADWGRDATTTPNRSTGPARTRCSSSRSPEAGEVAADSDAEREAVEQPAKVMRIGSMIKQLLEEVRQAPLDEASRARLREIYDTSVAELSDGLSPDLRDELARMASPFGPDEVPSEGELRVAQAQLVGWLEGLFHGIQATLFAQQMAARAQLEQMRQRSLPAGADDRPGPGPTSEPAGPRLMPAGRCIWPRKSDPADDGPDAQSTGQARRIGRRASLRTEITAL